MSIAKLKDAGGTAAGLLLALAFLAIPIMFLFGAAEFSVWRLIGFQAPSALPRLSA
jgi:hypothetical protein